VDATLVWTVVGSVAGVVSAVAAAVAVGQTRSKRKDADRAADERPREAPERPAAERSSSPRERGHEPVLSSPEVPFVGRRDDLARLLKALKDPQIPLIVVKGIGGIGKTALAQEAIRILAAEEFFNRTVWRSTQAERFVGEGAARSEVTDYSFDALLADILTQSGMASSAGAPTAIKLGAVRELLSVSRALIVLDNLETVPDRDALVASLFEILGKGKLLVTSRYALVHDRAFTVDLEGLSVGDGIDFLRETAKGQNNQNLMDVSRATLTRIHDVTGGAPLAMKLVAGQMYYQPVDYVLKVIEKAGINKISYDFYSFIFRKSWDELDAGSRRLLVAMRYFEGNPTADAVQHTVGMDEDTFYSVATVLIQRSLLNVAVVDGKEARYSLHPLTRYFINTDIAAGWN
jgi:hypothetical protein